MQNSVEKKNIWPKAIIKGIRPMHSVEAYGKDSPIMHLVELSKMAFNFALGIQCHFGLSVSL